VIGTADGAAFASLDSTHDDPRCGSFVIDESILDSSSESHWLQSGHLPIHRECVEPQLVHVNIVRVFAMREQ
jgi:hypothetical protein